MKNALIIALSLVSASLAACVNTRGISYETQIRPQRASDYPIEILDRANITRAYKVIGMVEANAGRKHNAKDTLESLKAEARRMGGDALINLQRGSGAGVIAPLGSGYAYGDVREIWTAEVIVWEN